MSNGNSIVQSTNEPWPRRMEDILARRLFYNERQRSRAKYCPELTYGRHFAPPGPTARPAAVMILMEQPYESADWRECTLPLTVRPTHMSDHPGQISFPGGRLEHGESYEEAAIREFNEELGLEQFPGNVLGSLLPMWVFNSDHRLTPFVATHTGQLDYRPNAREVQRVIRLPVGELLKDSQPQTGPFARGSVHWTSPLFEYRQDQVWGATAVVLAELAEVLRSLDREDN